MASQESLPPIQSTRSPSPGLFSERGRQGGRGKGSRAVTTTGGQHPSAVLSASWQSPSMTYGKTRSRQPLRTKSWAGDQTLLLQSLEQRATALKQRLELLTDYSETQRLPSVSPLDSLADMPYRSYGLQTPEDRRSPVPYRGSYFTPRGYALHSSLPLSQHPQLVTPVGFSFSSFGHQRTSPPSGQRCRSPTRVMSPSLPEDLLPASPSLPVVPYSKDSPVVPFRPGSSLDFAPPFSQGGRTISGASLFSSRTQTRGSTLRLETPLMASLGTPGSSNFVSTLADGRLSRINGPVRDRAAAVDAVLMRIHHLIRDNETVDAEVWAATVIQKYFRGWVGRRRYLRGRQAIQWWRRQELSVPRQRVLEWLRRQTALEEFIQQVSAGQNRDLTRCCFAGWVINVEHMRRVKRKQVDRAIQMAHEMLRLKARDILGAWRSVALGDRSRKACYERHLRRCEAAKGRLTKMAEDMGWTGNITVEMIKRELHNESVNITVTRIKRRLLGTSLRQWANFAKLRRMAKGRHLESDRKYNRILMNKAFELWLAELQRKMASWKTKGMDFSRRRLWAMARRQGRACVQRWALRGWLRRVRIGGRLAVFMKLMTSRTLASSFRAFRAQVDHQVSLKLTAVQTWQLRSRDLISYPFRSWVKFTAQEKTIKAQRMKVAGNMLHRYRRRLLLRCFNALRINREAAKVSLEFQLAPEPWTAVSAFARPSAPQTPAISVNGEDAPSEPEVWDSELDKLDMMMKKRSERLKSGASVSRRRRHRLMESDAAHQSKGGILNSTASSRNAVAVSSSGPSHAQQAQSQNKVADGIMANLERNLAVVLQSELVEPDMEARRLRMFLEELGETVTALRASRPQQTENSRPRTSTALEDANNTSDFGQSLFFKKEGMGSMKTSLKLGESIPAVHNGSDSEGGHSTKALLGQSSKSLTGSIRSTKKRLSKTKTSKSKSITRGVSRHQRAFFDDIGSGALSGDADDADDADDAF